MVTGGCRALISYTGGGVGNSCLLPRKSFTRNVADMMITLSGGGGDDDADRASVLLACCCIYFSYCRFLTMTTRLNKPISKSVLRLRSCASSSTTTLYLVSSASPCNSRNNIPTVINLICV